MLVFALQRDRHHLSFGLSKEFETRSANHTFHFVFMAQLAPVVGVKFLNFENILTDQKLQKIVTFFFCKHYL